MNIPSRVNPFGYDNSTPPGYVRAEYLESTGAQYIDPLHVPTRQFGYEIKVTAPLKKITSSGFIWGCQTSSGGRRLWMQIRLDNQGEVAWGTPTVIFPLNGGLNEQTFSMNYKTNNLCILDDVVLKDLWNMGFDPVYHFTLFKSTFTSNTNFEPTIPVRIFFAKFSEGSEIIRNLIPSLDSAGTPCMYDTITGQPFRNSGTGQFTAGLTTKQALNLANLPATGGSMTVSLPLEAAFDDNVQSALNAAADKGWTITVQYRESELTTKNIPADFLESTGAQYIMLSEVELDSSVSPIEVKTRHLCTNSSIMGANHFALTEGSTDPSETLCWGLYRTSSALCCFASNGPGWAFRDDGLVEYGWYDYHIIFENKRVVGIKSDGSRVLCETPDNNAKATFLALFTDIVTGRPLLGKKSYFWLKYGEKVIFNMIPTLDSSGVPCMYDTVSGQNFYNANTAEGATPFIVGFDTTEKAAVSLSKLPRTTGGTLTVSLPAAAQDPATRVSDAIDIATNRGWTIITQYRED